MLFRLAEGRIFWVMTTHVWQDDDRQGPMLLNSHMHTNKMLLYFY